MSHKADTGATFHDVLRLAIDSRIAQIHTALPGRIEKYDHEKQQAQVLPLVKKKYRDKTEQSLPIIDAVPVIWPRTTGVGGATVSLTFPVRQGDLCLLLFSERALDNWLTRGGEQPPEDPRKYDLTDAVAIMGLSPFTMESKAENEDDVLLTYSGDGHQRRIQITPDMTYVRFDDSTLSLTHTGDFRARLAYDGDWLERKLEIQSGKTILSHGSDLILKFEPLGTEKIDLNYEGDKQLKVTANEMKLSYGANTDLALNASQAVLRMSGSSAELNSDGDVLTISTRNTSATVGGNLTADVAGDVTVDVDGSLNADVDEDLIATVAGSATLTVGEDLTADVTGDLTAEVDGDMEATATNIKLSATQECRLEGATVRVKTSDFDLGPSV